MKISRTDRTPALCSEAISFAATWHKRDFRETSLDGSAQPETRLARVLLPPGTYVSATCACGSTSDLPSDVLSAPEDGRKALPGFAARGGTLAPPPGFSPQSGRCIAVMTTSWLADMWLWP